MIDSTPRRGEQAAGPRRGEQAAGGHRAVARTANPIARRAFAPSRTLLVAAVLLAAALLPAGCATAPPGARDVPEAPDAFKADAGPRGAMADVPPGGEWWRVFADPALDDLIQRADRDNWTIKLAAARLAQARAAARSAFANRMPRIGAIANATRQEGTLTNAASASGNLFVAALNLSYEVDLFGRLAREAKAAERDAAAGEDLLRSARLLVRADVAESWFALRALDAERALVRDAVASRRQSSAITRGLVASGLAPELTAVRQRADTEAIAAEALTLDRRRAELENALSVLVGQPASTFHVTPLPREAAPPGVPAGIPGTVLARRPDVGAARQAMFAAQTRVGVARDSWLPTLSLTGLGGLASPVLGTLLRASAGAAGAGGLLGLPLLDGNYGARVDKANADLDAATATYAQQILVAIKDVEDQLSGLRLLAGQDQALRNATESARRTTALVASNYRSGLASQLELLDAQRNELRDRREGLRVRAARFQATVGLIRALGGGWEAKPPQGPRSTP